MLLRGQPIAGSKHAVSCGVRCSRLSPPAVSSSSGKAGTVSHHPGFQQQHQHQHQKQQEQQQEQQEHQQQDDGSSHKAQASACPFLAALPVPPPAQHAWWNRLQQLTAPEKFQGAALGPHSIATIPAQLGLEAFVILGTADMARTVLSGEGHLSLQGWEDLAGFSSLMGKKSLLIVQEPRHKYLRNLVMPAFSSEAIEQLTPRMEAVIGRYLQKWADFDQLVLAADELQAMTFDFIVAVIMGREYEQSELQALRSLYKSWAGGLLAWPFLDIPFTPFGNAMAARKQLIAALQKEIDKGRQAMADGKPMAGILGSFLAASDADGNKLTDEELQDNLLLLLLAGHDTTSSSLVNVLAKLQQHPHVVQKLREEQEQLVARLGPALDGVVLKEMHYTDAVIKETLRLANVVGALTRKAAIDFEMGGHRIPAGHHILVPMTLLAKRDPRWVGDPDDVNTFRPERMMHVDTAATKTSWSMPFGHGPRFCAGYAVAMAEMRVFLALLTRHYDFSADINTEWVTRIGPTPKNGLPLSVTRRRARTPVMTD